MKSWPVRALFACLILGAVLVKVAAAPEAERDIHAATREVLARHGLPARLEPALPGSIFGSTIAFAAPGCQGEVRLVPIGINLQEQPLFATLLGAGETMRLLYLGGVWSEPDRLELRLKYLREKLLAILRLGRFIPDKMALLMVEPKGCRAWTQINWDGVWQR